jgi:hypothetical protein
VIFTKLLKIAMLHVVLDFQKIYKIVLEKAVLFVAFLAFLVLVRKKLTLSMKR